MLRRRKRRNLFIVVGLLAALVLLWAAGPWLPGKRVTGHGPRDGNQVALTFDDGPNERFTPQVLSILQEYDARATFFLVGENLKRHPETARLIVQEGSQVGNHSLTHSNWLPWWTPWGIGRDTRAAAAAISAATGQRPRFYRAPHGRVSPWMRWEVRRTGMQLVGWELSTGDWASPGVQTIVARALDGVRPGSIILLHDGLDLNEHPDKTQLLQALPLIIQDLQRQGYRLVTLAQLMKEPAYAP